MPDTKISGLTAASAALGADLLPIDEAGTSKSLSVAQLSAFVNAQVAVQPANHGLLVWNFDIAFASNATVAMATAGTVYTASLWLSVAMSITNIEISVNSVGVTLTSGQCFAALYGSTGTLIGVTADQHTAWMSNGNKRMALVSGPFAVPAGLVNIGLWFNGTTGPQLTRGAGNSAQVNYGLAAAASRFGTADTGITTTAPNPLGTRSASAASTWVGLS